MNDKPILRELRDYKAANILVEKAPDIGGEKSLFMKGIFIEGDVRNHNQRIYPAREIQKAVIDMQRRISLNGPIQGENMHPDELEINLDRVSHLIEDMWIDGNAGCGKLRIIPTPMGNIIRVLLESGAKLGVSSRGSGNVDDNGYVSDFDIVTVDIVAQPSAPNAYPRPIYESIYNMRGGSRMFETARVSHIDAGAKKQTAKDIMQLIKELKT